MSDGDIDMRPDTPGQMVFKNHVTYILQNLIGALLGLGLIALIWWSNGILETMFIMPMFLIVFIVAYMFVVVRIWYCTTFVFGESEVEVTKNTLFRKVTNIQYTKLASVNVRRTIFNHIFGTTTLLFNVNSSVNSTMAEVNLTLKSDEADRLREFVSSRILQRAMVLEEDRKTESLVEISNADVILHGLFGQPTAASIVGFLSLGYSVITFILGAIAIAPIIIFVFSIVVPWIRTILRYYNYRIYRVGDTITVESGLISNYRSSFNTKKINSVRIRQPLIARAMHKSLLEAEVVGLADTEGMPLLCPLKNDRTVNVLAQQLVPELLFETSGNRQPRSSLVPTMVSKVFWSGVSLAICAAAYLFICTYIQEGTEQLIVDILKYSVYAAAVAAPVFLICQGILSYKGREFEMGDETFLFITGAYDRHREYIRFDKVQMASVASGPIQRRYGLGRCTVNLMSSRGVASVVSGIFDRDELEQVSSEVMARIRDGRYDYRRYQ